MGPIDWQKDRPLSKMPNRLQPMSCGFHEGYDRKVGTYVVPFTILHDNRSCRASLCASTSQCYIHIGATIWLGHASRQGSCIHLGLPHLNVRRSWDPIVRNRPSSSTPIQNIELFKTSSKWWTIYDIQTHPYKILNNLELA
jgi:hypothetical protein